jgi:hypothetical protein
MYYNSYGAYSARYHCIAIKRLHAKYTCRSINYVGTACMPMPDDDNIAYRQLYDSNN